MNGHLLIYRRDPRLQMNCSPRSTIDSTSSFVATELYALHDKVESRNQAENFNYVTFDSSEIVFFIANFL